METATCQKGKLVVSCPHTIDLYCCSCTVSLSTVFLQVETLKVFCGDGTSASKNYSNPVICVTEVMRRLVFKGVAPAGEPVQRAL